MSATTMREQAMATVVDLFERDEHVALIMADISLDYLRPAVEHDPRRAINVGIMEQSAIGVAAGFALEGFHPIVHTLAPFLTERPLEQLKLDFGYQGLGGLFISAGRRLRLRTVRRHAPFARRSRRRSRASRGSRSSCRAVLPRPTRSCARPTRTAGRRTCGRAWSRTQHRSSSLRPG